MKYVLDTHSHTIASGHAYSTIREMAKSASNKGLELISLTEHAPTMPGTAHDFYFMNLRVIDREMYDVKLLMGVELNILDKEGKVDLSRGLLKKMDIAVASMHTPCYTSGSAEENTQAYIHVMENPYVHIIGHPDDSRYPVDYEELARQAKKSHTLLEVNNSSLTPGCSRENSEENTVKLLKYCMKYETSITIGSDAHIDTMVGNHQYAKAVLESVDFPEELVVNRSVKELKKFVAL